MILLKNILNGNARTDILVKDGRIAAIGPQLEPVPGAEVLDGSRKAVIPAFLNMHTHAGMRPCSTSTT